MSNGVCVSEVWFRKNHENRLWFMESNSLVIITTLCHRMRENSAPDERLKVETRIFHLAVSLSQACVALHHYQAPAVAKLLFAPSGKSEKINK